MEGIEFYLPELNFIINNGKGLEKDNFLLAIAGGRKPKASWLRKAARHLSVFCADKGIEIAAEAGLKVQALYGDADSADLEYYEAAVKQGTYVERFPREKDATDLQLLLKKIPAGNLLISGIWGGRFDHLYSNVFSLLAWKKNTQRQVILADDKEVMLLLQSGESVEVEISENTSIKALSLLTLSENVEVDLNGVHWPLANAKLNYLHPYAISNEAEENNIKCSCHSGDIGIYICLQE